MIRKMTMVIALAVCGAPLATAEAAGKASSGKRQAVQEAPPAPRKAESAKASSGKRPSWWRKAPAKKPAAPEARSGSGKRRAS